MPMDVVISTRYGQLKGSKEQGINVWRGIPYAKPPVGALRFRAPKPPHSWEGIRDALRFGPPSLQPNDQASGLMGAGQDIPDPSEDCLYLNVWAPDTPSQTPRPVMVWIHGGAFVSGAGSVPIYDGRQLAARGDLIVVTINYRLGPFGFLHLSSFGQEYDANVGLLDQIAALEWVRDNIEAFGGDPHRVTVFGESAGSMSIAALLAMPAAKGLFQAAIMESGASQVLAPQPSAMIAAGFLRELGLAAPDLAALRALPAEHIFEAGEALKRRIGGEMSLLFQPAIDPATLPEEPAAAIERGAAAGIPLLIGTNRDEGAFFIREGGQVMSPEEIEQTLEHMTGIKGAGKLASNYPATIQGQAQVLTDLFFWRSALRFAEGQAAHAPVWMYRFDWTLPGHPLFGQAVHAAELVFVFHNLHLLRYTGITADEGMEQLAERMQDAWIAFAYQGDPQTEAQPWPAYDTGKRMTLVFDRKDSLVEDPDGEKRALIGM
ncbi:carboxylesterase/lipase family protein [Paenibacillus sp. CAA11]|uniref:carboxylesterase/lipase family protein n=1 Tax=Paenibacillus sp. CAA11 TaxID=1532905 RepID=UPI00269F96A6|nr:carboxylesterase/lipase family protein [Paenibacillus sp. CAA11]